MDVTEAADWRKAVYAVTFGDDIFRIGSSLGRLVLRVGSVTLWQRHSTGTLCCPKSMQDTESNPDL